MKIEKKKLPDMPARGFDLQSIIIKRKFNMQAVFNWKTTILGILIVVIKFLGSTFGLSPDLIASIITILTALIGYVAGDGSKTILAKPEIK